MTQDLPSSLAERYEGLGVLGRGGMGVVFRARDIRLEREVAIKLLHVDLEDTVLERFRREAEALAGIRHPNIIEVYDHGVCPEGPYIVMELLEGRELEVQLPSFDPLEGLLPVADALVAVHERGLVHRDVKPGNIIRTTSGRCVLMDFGLIYVDDRTALTETGAVSGTVTYMSPETMQLAGPPSPAADWWALGVTLYVLYEGRLPYDLDAVMGFASKLHVPPLEFPSLDPESRAGRAIRALLQEEPERRPRSRAELEAVADGEALPGRSARPDDSPGPAASSVGPRLAPWRAGLAAAAVSVGLVAGFLSMGDRPSPPPTAPAPPRVEPATHGVFGPAFLARARRELEDADRLAVTRNWRVVPRTDPEAWRGLKDLDPVVWGVLWGELEHVVEFHAWLDGGGRPEELDAGSRKVLRQVDELHAGQLLPPPFEPLLAGPEPEPQPVPIVFEPSLEDWPPLADTYDGWLGTTLAAYGALVQFELELQKDLDASVAGRPTSEHFPRSQGLATTVWRTKIGSFCETYFMKLPDRLALRRWTDRGVLLYRRLLYAHGRALRPGQPNRDIAAIFVDRFAPRQPPLYSELARLDPELAYGTRARDALQQAQQVSLEVSGREILHKGNLVDDSVFPPLVARARRLLDEVDTSTPAGRGLWAALVRIGIRAADRGGSAERFFAYVDGLRDQLDALEVPNIRVRAAVDVFELWSALGHDAPLDADLKRWTLGVLRSEPVRIERLELRRDAPTERIAVLGADL